MQVAVNQGFPVCQKFLTQESNLEMKLRIIPQPFCFMSDIFGEIIVIGIPVRIREDQIFSYFTQVRVRKGSGTGELV
ncbi:hypothetical protein D3C71_2195080 [compost metagenome]